MFSINKEVKVEFEMYNKILCGGCLSADRKLTHPEIYLDLLSKLFDEKQDLKFSDILLCWECMALLFRIERFQRRIHRAQATLRQSHFNEMLIPDESFSNLRSTINSHVIDVYHEENIILETKNEVDIKDVKVEFMLKNDFDHESRSEHNFCSDNEIDNKHLDLVPDVLEKPITENVIKRKRLQKNVKKSEKIELKTVKSFKRTQSQTNYEKYQKKAEMTKLKFSKADTEKYFRKIIVTEKELQAYLEKEKGSSSYLNKPYKCEKCVYGFEDKMSLKNHNKQNHSEANAQNACNICDIRLSTKEGLMEHRKTHFCIYQCMICQQNLLHESEKINHLNECHSIGYKCLKCTAHFVSRKECNMHHQEMHKELTCDHCGKNFKTKPRIATHIKRTHGPYICEVCGREYNKYHSLENHYRAKHPFVMTKDLKSENCYCVECDKYFNSKYKYRQHLATTLKHRPQQKISIPCPECGKVFSTKKYLKYHLKLMHTKTSEHHCEICDKYFVIGYKLRMHIRTAHDKIAMPKNKICNVCGRGFNTNRILTHHMRTHTGERPFKCEHCNASFAQKTAFNTHTKMHLKDKKISPLFLTPNDTKT